MAIIFEEKDQSIIAYKNTPNHLLCSVKPSKLWLGNFTLWHKDTGHIFLDRDGVNVLIQTLQKALGYS